MVQEEVESRTTNLIISVTKLTARALYTAYVKHRQKAQSRKQAARDADALSAAFKEYMASVMKKQHHKKLYCHRTDNGKRVDNRSRC